jgi:methionyl-tRNA synthetase
MIFNFQNLYNELKMEYELLIDNFIKNHNFREYFDIIDKLNRNCNKIIVETQIWKLEENKQVYVLTELLININIVNKLMIPVIPSKENTIKMFNISNNKPLKLDDIKFKMFDLI